MKLEADLYLVGIGLYDLRQVTCEAVDVLKSVHEVHHFTGKHNGLLDLNSAVFDENHLYASLNETADVHEAIATHLVERAKSHGPIAVVFDGNPMFFCTVSWKAAELGQRAGLRVEAMAGVSCMDVLPIQLGFDPGDLGMQMIESTCLVRYALTLNPHLPTLLLQVAHFECAPGLPPPPRSAGDFNRLSDHLLQFFPSDHLAVFIQSASGEGKPTLSFVTNIVDIDAERDRIVPGMTLYVPRLALPPEVDRSRGGGPDVGRG